MSERTLISLPSPPASSEPLLSIRGLRTYFHQPRRGRFVRAVDGLDLQVFAGETLVLVGESGSGKTASMLSLLGLLSTGPGVISGRALYRPPRERRTADEPESIDLLDGIERFARFAPGPPAAVHKNERGWRRWSERRLRPLRGRDFAMIFQNPRSALHPYFTVGQQLVESLRRAEPSLGARSAHEQAADWLARVHIDSASRRMNDYPHALSGGMCQRVMIAMALCTRPALLIADEPTTGLDATVQSRVLDLLEELQAASGTTMIVVTHDMGVARRLADRVAVLYAGRVVESGPASAVLDAHAEPKHPYTRGLLGSIPSAEDIRARQRLRAIPGDVPDLSAAHTGCRFAERCTAKFAIDAERCESAEPELEAAAHAVRCWVYEKRGPRGEAT